MCIFQQKIFEEKNGHSHRENMYEHHRFIYSNYRGITNLKTKNDPNYEQRAINEPCDH